MADRCRSCGADVIFVPSAKTGRPMILDAKPEKRVVLVGFDAGGNHGVRSYAEIADDIDRARAHVKDVYTDHHVTCPEASSWKGRSRKDPPVQSRA